LSRSPQGRPSGKCPFRRIQGASKKSSFAGSSRHTGGPMKRVAGLVVVGLILFLYVPSARSVMCPASGQPSVACDASGNCFRHCCLSSGICPVFSCTTSLDLQSDRGTICAGNCRQELLCRPFSVDCVSDGTEVCIGTTVCKTADCAGRRAGELCLIAPGGAVKICAGAE